MRRTLAAAMIGGALLASPAAAQRVTKMNIVTPSGNPEMMLPDRTLAQAHGQMALICDRLGWTPRIVRGYDRLECSVPSDETQAVWTGRSSGYIPGSNAGGDQASDNLMDLRSFVPIAKFVRFTFAETEGGVLATAQGFRDIPKVSGMGREDVAMVQPATFAGLLHVMALAEGRLPATTTFRDFGYVGVRTGATAANPLAEKRIAIEVDGIDPQSPAEQAGLRQGDMIRSVNGKTFRDYQSFANYMSRVRPGRTVTYEVDRAGEALTLQATAAARPTQVASASLPGKG